MSNWFACVNIINNDFMYKWRKPSSTSSSRGGVAGGKLRRRVAKSNLQTPAPPAGRLTHSSQI